MIWGTMFAKRYSPQRERRSRNGKNHDNELGLGTKKGGAARVKKEGAIAGQTKKLGPKNINHPARKAKSGAEKEAPTKRMIAELKRAGCVLESHRKNQT